MGESFQLSEKFKETLSEIQEAMGQGKERSQRLSQENQRLSDQLQALVEKYEAKEVRTLNPSPPPPDRGLEPKDESPTIHGTF